MQIHDTRRQFRVHRTFSDRRQFATPGHQITRLSGSRSEQHGADAVRDASLPAGEQVEVQLPQVRIAECCGTSPSTRPLDGSTRRPKSFPRLRYAR